MSKLLHKGQEAYLRTILNNIPFMMWIKDPEGHFVAVNDCFAESSGQTCSHSMIGKTDFDVWPQELAERYRADDREVMEQKKHKHVEEAISDIDSSKWLETFRSPIIDDHGNVIGTIGFCRDISERMRAEEDRLQLERKCQQVQKTESLDRMAGAVAHHFNNLLAIVVGNLELALSESLHDQERSVIKRALSGARMAAGTCRHLITYLGFNRTRNESHDMSRICKEYISVLQGSIPAWISLHTDFPSPGPIVMINEDYIRQVLVDLTINACEAIGEQKGAIRLSVSIVSASEIKAQYSFPVDWKPQGTDHACLTVTDTGCGMEQDVLTRLFDPFFSTKFAGRGLGLAVTAGIVRAHGGVLTVVSERSKGSSFRIYLPVVTKKIKVDKNSKDSVAANISGHDEQKIAFDGRTQCSRGD
jgi:PAS domain S-box-containing protein